MVVEEMETVWGKVTVLSMWRVRKRVGRGSFPDSLEPCCNSLIETEWDVLITQVVKTKGGLDCREGRMCALIFGLREVDMRWDVFYKYKQVVDEVVIILQASGQTDSSSAAMNGHFSIEWMAQSSQQEGSETSTITVSGPTACGTLSESLPGFYCRQKSENIPKQKKQENRSQALEAYSQSILQQQTAPNSQGKSS